MYEHNLAKRVCKSALYICRNLSQNCVTFTIFLAKAHDACSAIGEIRIQSSEQVECLIRFLICQLTLYTSHSYAQFLMSNIKAENNIIYNNASFKFCLPHPVWSGLGSIFSCRLNGTVQKGNTKINLEHVPTILHREMTQLTHMATKYIVCSISPVPRRIS